MRNNLNEEELRKLKVQEARARRRKKEKFRVMKNRVIATGVLIAVGVGLPIGISRYNHRNDTSLENEIGYSDFTLFNDLTNRVKEKNFVILNVGDYDSNKSWFVDEKVRYCNENNISVGIVINSNSEREVDIYNDVEYAKSLVSKYKIDFPVYLDINGIITNDNLNNELKTKLIKDFLEKCSANNIYVGMYGTDTNLCRVRKYCGIKDYDAYLVMDNKTVLYDGTYNIVKDQEGNIESRFNVKDKDGSLITTNMASVLEDKNLNDKEKFSNDGSYTISKDEDILDIALKFGLSVNELLEFNNIRKDDIIPGLRLRIPSIIEKNIPILKEETKRVFTKLDNPIRGCDLSYAQGNDHDWNKLKQNFKYIIARCSQGLMEDTCFEYNVKNCNLNNISVGVYCYNDYNMKNCQDIDDFTKCQNAQADYVLSLLKNKKIDYPVYLDIEETAINSYNEFFSKEYIDVMLNVWKNKIESAGYTAGIYCNKSMYNFLNENTSYDLSDFQLWIAGGKQYTGETEDIPLEEVIPSFSIASDTSATMVQSTDSAVGAGASNGPGHLDINYSMVDYSIKTNRYEENENKNNDWKIKESEKIGKEDVLLLGAVSSGILALGGTWMARKNKKEKEIINNNRMKR